MAIYRDTNSTVVFEHPFEGPLDAIIRRKGIVVATAAGLHPTEGRYEVPLDYNVTREDGTLEITYVGQGFNRTQRVEVVTPIVPLSRLKEVYSEQKTEAELRDIEAQVRVVVERYTGTSFGYSSGVVSVVGTGSDVVPLPMRAVKIDAVEGGYMAGEYAISSDGWSLYIVWDNTLNIKQAPPEESVMVTYGVIRVPQWYSKGFREGVVYRIAGEFGYPDVPEDVQEAALLLARDYEMNESLYRDRYVDAIRTGDWRLEFNAQSFSGTGNARADQLLDKYKRQSMAVI